MTKLLVPMFLCSVLALAAVAADGGEKTHGPAMLLDGVAAYVNSEMITVSDVMDEVRRSPMAAGRNITEARLRELYTATLNALIDRKLILVAARNGKMQLQPWAVEARIREIVTKRFNNDQSKLHALLAEMKITYEEWRATIEEDLLVSAMRYQNVDRKISPTPAEIRAEYDANRTRYQTETAVAVSMIILDPPAEKEDSVEMRAGKIQMALESGEKFADLAKKYSRDAKAKDGGSWGKVNPDDVFRREIAEVVHKLKPGEVSEMLKLDGYGYIIRKDDDQDARILTFEEAAPYVESRLRAKLADKYYREWIDRLRSEAYIKFFELPSSK
ncbi:MAG: peptidyl-prolyl cis-trans isomerase [Kiritimatiellae bacterium]|nr:peptidyl-prolyl cis-trans isomerase [Kiritimatiellia bacterium]